MLKIGSVYKTKKPVQKVYCESSECEYKFFPKESVFTVLEETTDEDEDEWRDFKILHDGNIFIIGIKLSEREWSRISDRFELVC